MLSIIVPTLDRRATLRHTLRTIALQEEESFECIISDNRSSDDSFEIAKNLASCDKRFVCVQTEQRLSMSKHWEFALEKTSGEYICFLGDDDGLMPGALERAIALLAELNCPEALNSANCEYHWPSSPLSQQANTLKIPKRNGMQEYSSVKALRELARGEKLYTELPMLYRGWVRREALENVKRRTGKVFRSCVPDIYSSIAVASVSTSYWWTTEPLFIEGVSGYSNGAQAAAGSLDADASFFIDGTIPFHESLPYCPATSFLVAESLLQAHKAGLIERSMLMRNRRLLEDTLRVTRSYSKERREQCLQAANEVAENTGNVSSYDILKTKFADVSSGDGALPPVAAWTDHRYGKFPALTIRTDVVGCNNVEEVFKLLDVRNPASNATMQLLRAIGEDMRFKNYEQTCSTKSAQLDNLLNCHYVRLALWARVKIASALQTLKSVVSLINTLILSVAKSKRQR
jgi:hypothetical protein